MQDSEERKLREPSAGEQAPKAEKEQPPKRAKRVRIYKPKVKKTPKLERGPLTRLQYLAAGDLFEIGGVLYRFQGTDGIGIQVNKVTPIPGGFSTGRELRMGDNTICLPVEVV